jgi:hypothetical protein
MGASMRLEFARYAPNSQLWVGEAVSVRSSTRYFSLVPWEALKGHALLCLAISLLSTFMPFASSRRPMEAPVSADRTWLCCSHCVCVWVLVFHVHNMGALHKVCLQQVNMVCSHGTWGGGFSCIA